MKISLFLTFLVKFEKKVSLKARKILNIQFFCPILEKLSIRWQI